jgi:ABC-type sugar transport system substrate-binding protein
VPLRSSKTVKSDTAPGAVLSGAVVLATTLALSACSSSSSEPSVAAILKGLDNPFFQTMQSGVQDAAGANKVKVEVQAATSVTDTAGQADKFAALANQDYSCFIVNPISGTNLIRGIAKLSSGKKTIVNIDSPVDPDAAKQANATIASYIGTDNEAAGKLAAGEMLKLLPGGGKVVAIGGTSGDVTSAARITGFQEAAKAQPSITILPTVAANWDRQEALTQASTLLRANPDLAGFFVANDDMALGVARAVASANKTGAVKIVSVDGLKEALEGVKSGELSAVVAQYPFVIGQMGVEACKAVTAGKTLPANVAAPVELVTKDNADQAIAATPKPFGEYADPFTALLK